MAKVMGKRRLRRARSDRGDRPSAKGRLQLGRQSPSIEIQATKHTDISSNDAVAPDVDVSIDRGTFGYDSDEVEYIF